jgi:UDP-glucose 4-epimerase
VNREYFKGKKILITGGLGFLGSNLARHLVDLDAHITIIDNMNPMYGGNWFNISGYENKINVIDGSYLENQHIAPVIPDTDIIYHFAAQVSYIDSMNNPMNDLDLNARGTLSLLLLCKELNPSVKIIFSSSRMVLGKMHKENIDENHPTNPLSLYGIHKLMSEKYFQMFYKDYGIPFVALRITNPYGKRQQIKHSKYSLVGWFVRQAMEGKAITIFGEGHQLRDYIYVDDIVEGFIRAGSSSMAEGQIINLGSGQSTKFRKMAETIVKIVGNGKVEYVPWPKDYENIETGNVVTDLTKMKNILQWSPITTLEDGIKYTYNYYQKYMDKYIEI